MCVYFLHVVVLQTYTHYLEYSCTRMLFAFAACKAVVDEVQYSVRKVSPHKTYQVGKFNSCIKSNNVLLVV